MRTDREVWKRSIQIFLRWFLTAAHPFQASDDCPRATGRGDGVPDTLRSPGPRHDTVRNATTVVHNCLLSTEVSNGGGGPVGAASRTAPCATGPARLAGPTAARTVTPTAASG